MTVDDNPDVGTDSVLNRRHPLIVASELCRTKQTSIGNQALSTFLGDRVDLDGGISLLNYPFS